MCYNLSKLSRRQRRRPPSLQTHLPPAAA
uniref:Uncharacterized protein n=1 Tax=Tetranychus urticae TaxID=32264 RepID=T1KFF2_TETUR